MVRRRVQRTPTDGGHGVILYQIRPTLRLAPKPHPRQQERLRGPSRQMKAHISVEVACLHRASPGVFHQDTRPGQRPYSRRGAYQLPGNADWAGPYSGRTHSWPYFDTGGASKHKKPSTESSGGRSAPPEATATPPTSARMLLIAEAHRHPPIIEDICPLVVI